MIVPLLGDVNRDGWSADVYWIPRDGSEWVELMFISIRFLEGVVQLMVYYFSYN